MKQFSYETTRALAAHAKPLGRLLREASRFASRVTLRMDGAQAGAVRLQDLMDLGVRGRSRITVTIEGRDEEAAVAAIQNYVVANF